MEETAGKELEEILFGKKLPDLSQEEKQAVEKSLQKSYEKLEKDFEELEQIKMQAAREALKDGVVL